MRIDHRQKTRDCRPERELLWPKVMYVVVFASVLLFCSVVRAEDKQIEITADVENVEKGDIYIGDRINTDVVLYNALDADVDFPEVPPDLGDFSFVSSRPMEFGWRDKDKKGYVYVMGVYSTGTHVIPPIPVRYKRNSDAEWQVIESPQIPLDIKSTLTGKDTDIKDIKGLLRKGPLYFIVLLLVLFMFIVAAGIVIWRIDRKKKQLLVEKEKKMPAHEIAYMELEKLKKEDLPGHGKTKEYYFQLSDIVRHYLENRFYFKAPEMTTEEFMEVAKKAKELEEEHKALLNDFLSRCDMVKFAKYGPTPIEMLDSFSSAERFVDQTKIIEEETADEKE